MLRFIADIATGDQRIVDDDITNVLRALEFPTLLVSKVLAQQIIG
jgi:hypothetical protein